MGKSRRQVPKVPKPRGPSVAPRGPRLYRPQNVKDDPLLGGPGEPPNGFIGPANSKTEWYVYWALARIFQNPVEPRLPPFEGGYPDWTYQKVWDGGREQPGGSVIDFVVYSSGRGREEIALRIVTEYWHLYTTNENQVRDQDQRTWLEDRFDVIDLYDQDFINDPTGQAVIIQVKNVIGLIERPNPLWAGTALRGTRMDLIGGV